MKAIVMSSFSTIGEGMPCNVKIGEGLNGINVEYKENELVISRTYDPVKLKSSAIVCDLTTYLKECSDFETKHKVVEKHVSTQIIQMPNPLAAKGIQLSKHTQMVTTVMISILYVHEETKLEVTKN